MADASTVDTTIVWTDGEADSVAIRGTFGSDSKQWWEKTIPLRRAHASGIFSVVLALAPGRYEFKYVVNGSDWRVSPSAYPITNDGHGNSNNVIAVVAPAAATNGQRDKTETALSVGESEQQTTIQNASERTRLLATRPNKSKAASSSLGNQDLAAEDGRRLPRLAVGEDGYSEPLSSGGGNEPSEATWSRQRIVVATLVLLLFVLLGAASALYYE
ncbi:5'-AMP-activated protein kinase subunit beta-2 [Coemansia thaxteri]|uniref:5'-AMP-activated protein kinase subunit beta-2 n=1 Tax=Coemansia thaxteri TaxID=2663907 RepID=A0A9W8EE27_9FUNG|nr:5'-AMP-activated protein kinase subunit beta-2 [Coemansia thaxteri]KAJ2001695.1 5'-AMP-activated protein kinase subunit beta-2 [Coemansia thaxteri]KAJ2468676.1 5'-AMP-activated protein kinase subunit beta-2 [Coemansia sp. RSA 2322]KAJ2485131.1 5'-AMP-activated protein kinase subunit beta-2 [Coemansia sp. RSA 2320]